MTEPIKRHTPTREEVRALRREREDMFASGTRVVKVRLKVEIT